MLIHPPPVTWQRLWRQYQDGVLYAGLSEWQNIRLCCYTCQFFVLFCFLYSSTHADKLHVISVPQQDSFALLLHSPEHNFPVFWTEANYVMKVCLKWLQYNKKFTFPNNNNNNNNNKKALPIRCCLATWHVDLKGLLESIGIYKRSADEW